MLAPREAPQLILESFNATSFIVSWTRESCLSRNGPDRYYTVSYHVTETTQVVETTTVNINNTIFIAVSLNPVTSYTIHVAYINTIGSGPNNNLTFSTLGFACK